MTKEREMQHHVRKAVQEYVDQLIQQRSGPGKGMAVSSNDLMVAARAAGHRTNKYENDQMLQQFVHTGIKVIHTTPRKDISPKLRLHGSQLTYNPLKTKSKAKPEKDQQKNNDTNKEKKEQHWLTWRTSPTPTPPPSATPARPVSRAVTPARPTSVARPVSKCRTATPAPRTQTPALRIPTPAPPTPAMSEATLPIHLAPTPEPESEVYEAEYVGNVYKSKSLSARPASEASKYNLVDYQRAATPMTERVATPLGFNPHYRDNMTTPQVMSMSARYHHPVASDTQSVNPTFVPALKAWVHSANDYERDVAFSLFQALGGKAPDPPSRAVKPRPKSAYSSHRRNPVAGVQTTMSAWEAYNNSGLDNQNLSLCGQAIVQHHVPTQSSNYQRYGRKGTKSSKQRIVFPPKDYTCESSFFVNSMQPFKRDFVINPEWASESKGAVAKQYAMLMAPKPTQGVRF